MSAEKYVPGIGVVAGSYMLKWDIIKQQLQNTDINIQPGDEVNIFINFESILKNLINRNGLLSIISYHKQHFVIELESAVLNLMGNYRTYFIKEKCIPKVYLYHTSLDKQHTQQMAIYNKFYRNFYANRYTQNPKFREAGKVLCDTIIPELKLILSYIPNCYFIESKTFDSSIIPQVISTLSSSKNVIITGDIFDTLYMFNSNFATIYINRKFHNCCITSDIPSTVQSIIKDESPFDLTIFNSELYYRMLLSIKGSKIRNIRSAKGFGYSKFVKILKSGLDRDIILKDFSAIDSILDLFPLAYQKDIKEAFQCTDIRTQFELLSDVDIEEIKSQIVDKIDITSVEALNNKRFFEFPINLPMLL